MAKLPELTEANAHIFRITHKNNLPWILQNGIHCRKSKDRDPNFTDIGIVDLIEKRHLRQVGKDRTLSDYVPFYFTPLSMMAFNIHTGRNVKQRPNNEIVILMTSLRQLQKDSVSFVFTDRHASLIDAVFSADLKELNKIDWTILQNRDFSRDNDDIGKSGRYQAEALVLEKLSVHGIAEIACCDEEQRKRAEALVKERALSIPVVTRAGWYF